MPPASERPASPLYQPHQACRDSFLTLKDGRKLAYTFYGQILQTGTTPVFYFNGTPGSRKEGSLIDAAAHKAYIPIIAVDRPGFGDSSWQADRSLLDWPGDILDLADHLKVNQFGVIGLSGGGAYVLACLHAIRKARLVAASIVSGMYPWSLGTEGMMWQTKMLFGVAYYSSWLTEKMLDMGMRKMVMEPDRAKVIATVKQSLKSPSYPDADREVLMEMMEDEDLADAYLGSMREALKISSKGAAWELYILGAEWAFKLEDIDGDRLTMWHGDQDVNVSVMMPDAVARLIPGVRYNRVAGEGHVSLMVRRREQILAELGARLPHSQKKDIDGI